MADGSASLFAEIDPPEPAPVLTTAPLFDAEPATTSARRAESGGPIPAPTCGPAGHVPLFETALSLPSGDAAGRLACEFTLTG